jgi:PAS domain S-box-containing protein
MLMKDEDKPREQLISELTELRQQLDESKSSLEELKKSEVKYRMLAEATPAFIHVTQGNKFVYVNPGAMAFAGYTREDVMTMDFWDCIHPEFKELVKENHFLRQRGDKGPERYEFKVVAKNGQEHWVELDAKAVDWEGEPAVAALAYDITGHKKTEEELHRTHGLLEMRVQERTAELARANEALRAEIAERRQTEDQLRAAQRQLSEIIEFLPDATLVIDKGRRVIAWNKAIEEMTGACKEDVIGKGNYAYAVPFYGEPRPIAIDLAFLDDRETAQKYTCTEKVGDIIYAEVFIPSLYEGRGAYIWCKTSPLYSSEGVVIGAIESIRDITERKWAEQETREQLHFLQVLINAIPAPIFYKDPEGIYQGCNNAFASMFGMIKEDIIGKSVFGVSPEELGNKYREMDLALFKNPGIQVYDYKVRSADGLDYDVIFHKATYNDLSGRLAGMVGAVIDVTKIKQVEEKLRQRAAELQAVFQTLPDLYFRLSADGMFLELLAGTPDDLYLPAEEFLGKRIQDVLEPLGRQFQRAIDQVLRTRSLVIMEYLLPIKGETKFFEARLFPLLEDQIVMVVRNITERKRDEEELKKYRERLEDLVEQRTAELKAINKELESFSYSVSHDLRAPLRIIDGYSQILEEDYLENLGNEGMKNIQVIRSQCQRMGELINDILDLSRLSRKEMQLEDVNLSQLAESIAAELQRSEPERQVNFIITPNLEVRGDQQLLQSVLENLMNNAWKFTSKHPQAKIEFGVKKNGGKKAYFVRDDGAGFDMKYAQKLFGAFQRLHTIHEFPGTGVGLTIVQRIVHRHEGQVWAEGAEEKGATFYFTLNRQISGRANRGRKIDTSS